MASPPVLRQKPDARAETVEELVGRVLRGQVRIPKFQRGLKWNARDVTDLFDSVYRGYPVGSLLLWQRSAELGHLRIGPLRIDAPESSSAWWVVDGQQRLTALAASLGRPEPMPRTPDDPFVVYFDAQTSTFARPPRSGIVPTSWVPVSRLLDATQLSEWVDEWQHRKDVVLKRAVFEAGKRLREYSLPLYVVATDDEKVLQEIFHRVNNTGRKLDWSDVHDALFATTNGSPSTLEELSQGLADVGMGKLGRDVLLPCLLAFRGVDPTQSLAEHRRRDRDVLEGVVARALPVLRRVLSFLRDVAEIPHVRLLPRALPLVVLTRFFALHPEPNARTLQLLSRWTWRLFLTAGTYDDRVVLRRGISAIAEEGEEASAQRLIQLTPKRSARPFEMPSAFDARAAASRVVLVALASRGPRRLDTGEPVDVRALIEEEQARAFRAIVAGGGVGAGARTPANRILHPDGGSLRRLIAARVSRSLPKDEVLDSHVLSPRTVRHLAEGRTEKFLAARTQDLTALVNEMGNRLAGWAHSDRASIQHLLSGDEAPAK